MNGKEKFIVIIMCEVNGSLSANAIVFEDFDSALAYARKDSNLYKHLASTIEEKVGMHKKHATITLHGKHINKTYRISDLTIDKNIQSHLTTYVHCDFLHNDMMV